MPSPKQSSAGSFGDMFKGLVSSLMSNYQNLPSEGELSAQQELSRQGSVMARGEKPQFRKDNPTVDMLMSMIDKAIKVGGPDPLDAAGGTGKVVMSALGPVRTAAQKKILKSVFRADPETMQAVINTPRMLHITDPSPLRNAYGIHTPSSNRAFGGTVTLDNMLMKGKSPSSSAGAGAIRDINANVPSVALHEVQHFLNNPRIEEIQNSLGKYGQDEMRIMAKKLTPFISPQGQRVVHGKVSGLTEDNASALNEALSYLAESAVSKNPPPGSKELFNALKERPGNIPGSTNSPTLSSLELDRLIKRFVPNNEETVKKLGTKRKVLDDMFAGAAARQRHVK